MKYARVAALVFNRPLLIEPSRLLPITNYLLGRMQGQAPAAMAEDRLAKLEARRGDTEMAAQAQAGAGAVFDEYCGAITEDGIAVIPITGELVHRAGGVDADSGLLSYNEIERRLDAALADPRARGILLEVDSPGGEAAGAFTLADKIFKARAAKPIWALANESACSAAYALACATSRVLLPESGHVGSVGVIWQALDQSRMDQAGGLQYTVLQYGARKNDFNPHFPISKEAFTWAQAEVARLGEQFVALVARNRGIDPLAVRGSEAGLLFGPAAVKAGLADAILEPPGAGQTLVTKAATLLVAQIQTQYTGGQAIPAAARNHNPVEGVNPMANEEQKAASEQAAAQAQAAALDAARAEGQQAGQAAGMTAERGRIAAILNHPESAGREAVARGLALESGMDAEAVGKILAGTPKMAASPLAQAMAGIPEPQVGPDAPQALAQGAAVNLMSQIMARSLGLDHGQKGAR